ncbi:MAG: hypothetical protein RLZZ453_1189 [Chlamydiota bacterium]|jgi:hypothetical protein
MHGPPTKMRYGFAKVKRKGVTGGALRRDAPPDMSMAATPPTFTTNKTNNKWKPPHHTRNLLQLMEMGGLDHNRYEVGVLLPFKEYANGSLCN